MTDVEIATFEAAYIAAALWSSTDESRDDGGDPLDRNYGPADCSEELRMAISADCKAFLAAHYDDIASDLAQAGHDFWLTRNGHGCGFWDGDWRAAHRGEQGLRRGQPVRGRRRRHLRVTMIDRKSLAPGAWIEVADPTKRIFYGGLYQVVRAGRVNVRASCDVRFSPTGPWYHQEHVIPLAHVVRVVPASEVAPREGLP